MHTMYTLRFLFLIKLIKMNHL